MWNTRWRRRIGRGIIDTHFDSGSGTLSVADVAGRVAVVDASTGSLIQSHSVGAPVWGVAHRMSQTGELLVAVAVADNETSSGGILLYRNEVISIALAAKAHVWDVVWLDDSRLAFSTWAGDVLVVQSEGRGDISPIELGGRAYGLAVHGEYLYLVSHGRGVFMTKLSVPGTTQLVLDDQRACYNVDVLGDEVVVGSDDSVALLRGSSLPMSHQHVYACCLTAHLTVIGDASGTLRAFLRSSGRLLFERQMRSAVWDLSFDHMGGVLFVALGSGEVVAVELDEVDLDETSIQLLDQYLSEPNDHQMPVLSGPLSVAAAARLELELESMTRVSIDSLAPFFEQMARFLDGDRVSYVLGLSSLISEQYDKAIVYFQGVSADSPYRTKVLLPLAEAFEAIGSISSAIRLLSGGLELLAGAELVAHLVELARLSELKGQQEDALRFLELASALDHSARGVQEGLHRLRDSLSRTTEAVTISIVPAIETERLSPAAGRSLGTLRRGGYSMLDYVKYEYGSPADEAKKYLETDLMSLALRATESRGLDRIALDIGCATGRWPIWLSHRGYEAHGYDLSADSIALCRKNAAAMPDHHLHFSQYDIGDGALEFGRFSLITCMMGTFNHVAGSRRQNFLAGVRDSLAIDGQFVFTSWNVESPFCDFLAIDSQRAKDDFRANCLARDQLASELVNAGLRVIDISAFCFLPNSCYDVWEDDFRTVEDVVAFDHYLRDRIDHRRAQMLFVTTEHEGRP